MGRLLVSFTTFGLSATRKTDAVRYTKSQRQAFVADILYDQFHSLAALDIDKRADENALSAVVSLLCCLAPTANVERSLHF